MVEAGHDLKTTSYPLWTLSRDKVTELADEWMCCSQACWKHALFSSLLVHASPANISPFGRTIVYLSLCHVENHIRAFKRRMDSS